MVPEDMPTQQEDLNDNAHSSFICSMETSWSGNWIWKIPHFSMLLPVTQLVKKFSYFMENEGSLPCLQDPAIGPHPKPVEFSPHSQNSSWKK